jgi:hypothetical protein
MDSEPDPVTFKINPKNYLFSTFFCLLLIEATFTSFFKDKKTKKSHKEVTKEKESKIFLLFSLDDKREVVALLSCVGDHILQEFNTLFLTRFRTYKTALPPQTKT